MPRQKRQRNNYIENLYNSDDFYFGSRTEKLHIVNPLLPVGTLVTVWDVGVFERGHAFRGSHQHLNWMPEAPNYRKGKLRRHTYLEPHGGCDVYGNIKTYIIDAYTEGINAPLNPKNKVCLMRVINSERASHDSSAIPTIHIVTGSVILLTLAETEELERVHDEQYLLNDNKRFSYLT